ncbi:MAG: sensor histidine kinase [Brumimicrobium sp.]|nr:sensor histidine kinase [Brumimicrobium sp.]MCO5267303.1 sensor histidine kinase [Brumimicrobium sp.]
MGNILSNEKRFLFFKRLQTDFQDYREIAKFDFVWTICVFYVVCSGILVILAYLINDPFAHYFLLAFLFALLCYFMLKRFIYHYRYVINGLCFSITMIQYIALLTVRNDPHMLESVWMLVVALTAFFTLGRLWGSIYLFLNVLLYAIFFNFLYIEASEVEIIKNSNTLKENTFEYCVAIFIIGYIMFRYIKYNKQISNMHQEAILSLTLEKKNVEQKNKEAVVLLQEIHHRVKNNLQVIVSLLRIQSSGLQVEEAQESFHKAINRIMTMSLIHQKMYENKSLINIDLQDYIEKLLNDVISANSTKGDVKYMVNIHMKTLDPDRIVPLGLILNELISNSLKYAFEENGKIEISIYEGENQDFSMIYSDNGIWQKSSREDSFGIQLIDIFTEQLEGTYERIIDSQGTHYKFQFG